MVDVGIEELKEMYGREGNPDVRERILMILWLKSGKSTYEIGDLLFCPHSKVVYWKKRFERGGIEGLRTPKKPGRPVFIEKKAEVEISTELSGRDYWNTAEISDVVEEKSGIKYTRRHIRRLVQKWGYSLITPREKHMRPASEKEVEELKKKPQRYWALSGRE